MANLKASELRIGNLVEYYIEDSLDPRKAWWEINIIDADDIKYLSENSDCEDYRPIPLTEEWLEKFGFEEDETYISDQNPFLDYLKDELRISMPYFIFEYGDNGHPHIKHVHQLQNLYFALTGEELTFNKN
jgi:hypothetical protein